MRIVTDFPGFQISVFVTQYHLRMGWGTQTSFEGFCSCWSVTAPKMARMYKISKESELIKERFEVGVH